MALQDSDLLVVQTDDAQKKLYKLSISDLGTHLDAGGGGGTGTVESVQADLPLVSDGDTVNPTISSNQATSTAAGHVARTATAADVDASVNGAASTEAVVTADLLKASNSVISDNTDAINTNATDIGNNASAIAQNAADIAANTVLIGANAGDISDNAAAIAENSADIAGLETRVSALEAVDSIDGGVYAP